MFESLMRKASLLAGVGVIGAGTAVLTAAPAQASPFDCAWAPGTTLAAQCIQVGTENGTYIKWVQSRYEPGISSLGGPYGSEALLGEGNKCTRQHEVMFTPSDTGEAVTLRADLPGCVPGIVNDYMDWHDLGEAAPGTAVCTRYFGGEITKNQWTSWACRDIKTDSWWWGF